jgi:zinc transport system substrate-binding protein
VDVHTLIKPGQDPHLFEPTPRQMMDLSNADLYVGIELPFEKNVLKKIKNNRRDFVIVDASEKIKKRHIEESDTPHEHAHEHAGDKSDPDPHIWLSPPLLKVQARTICDALKKADPAHADTYEKNLSAFGRELDAVHGKLGKELLPYRGKTFLVFHPAFGYFADTYGLKQMAVETEGKQPVPQQIERIITRARQNGIKIIFIQPEFSTKSAEAVATAINGTVVPLDPLSKNVLNNFETIADRLSHALSGEKAKKPSTR